jgi:1-acyl-sn-glycerol-3-phosphate acyltransferase
MVVLRSILYVVFLAVTVVLFSVPLSIFGWFIRYAWLARLGQSWGRLNLFALRAICGLDVRVKGYEHLPSQNCIVLCKHQSAWETIALRALLPAEHTWVLKRELLWLPFFGWGIAPFRPIAIDRRAGRRAVRKLLTEGANWLNEGRWIVIFPEGTRVAPGQYRRYGIGGALLAEKTGYPVIPIAHNAGVFWSRRSFRKYPGTIDMVIGSPLSTKGRRASEINRAVEQWIEGTVAALPQSR